MNYELRMIEAKIFAAIDNAIGKVLQTQQEEWLSAKDLSERIPIFSADFIKKHGDCLPREKMEYYDDGKVVETRYMYPLHALNQMIQKGCFRTADGTMNANNTYSKLKNS